jgi:hypothetical protein
MHGQQNIKFRIEECAEGNGCGLIRTNTPDFCVVGIRETTKYVLYVETLDWRNSNANRSFAALPCVLGASMMSVLLS